jgi:phosphoribosylformimino-5-aminoimidazole carboxamide ribonucleotide (ProFAR) isomerase
VPTVPFILLPAVDVADGRAVRLAQENADTATTYGAPLDAALTLQAGGAEWIHLVDLDAAFGRGSNADLLAAIIGELDVRVELAGGICELYRAVTRATATPVIASGGVSTIDDLVALARIATGGANIEGSIVGKALGAGRFTLPDALEAMRLMR